MDSNKICFITCVNNDEYYQECLQYIHRLELPEGYSVETVAICDAVSMAAGLNEAMAKSDAKIKVYLHQDVFIIHKAFLKDIVRIFADPDIGLIGVIGSGDIPANGIWWEGRQLFGQVYDSHRGFIEKISFQEVNSEIQEVACVDGLIMITQYDLPWRAELFNNWHFYDLSQSQEFRRQGYKVVIPRQFEPWCIHDCGITRVNNQYQHDRQVFIQEYLRE
jgi:hypothetical protein